MVYGKPMYHLTEVFGDEQQRKDWQFWSRDETDDEAIIRRVVRDACEYQLKYRACAQTVLYALALHLGLVRERETIVAMTTLCGGFGGTEICGALVGGLAAIGLEFGRVDFTEIGGPHTRGHSSFTLAQALAAEAFQRFKEHTSGLVRCCDLCYKYFGTQVTPPDRSDPLHLERIKAGELYSMWSVEASQLTALAAEVACEIILRVRRQRGIVTPVMAFPWYNRAWESMQLTESLKPKG
jgi:C_GCAxxG_C_C family probable redox protein